MKKISSRHVLFGASALGTVFLTTSCQAQAPRYGALPVASTSGAFAVTTNVTDEPSGARDSLGLTLRHMGHDADYIQKFHQFLRAQNQNPQTLLPSTLNPPAALQRILIEPEHLAPQMLNGWRAQGQFIIGSNLDNGPDASMPLRVERAGTFRLWVGYYNWPTGTALTTLKLYRAGQENEAPLLRDEIYDAPQTQEGLAWHDVMVDLSAGDYTVKLGYARAWWHVTGGQLNKAAAAPQRVLRARQIDCLYLTEELWAGAPNDLTRNALRAGPGIGGQWAAQIPVANVDAWRWWQVRPLSWDERGNTPLFNLSRTFWRAQTDALAQQDYGNNAPDYRAPVRQIIFDDAWNMIGNPVVIRRRINELSRGGRGASAASPATSSGASYVARGSDFTQLSPGWEVDGTSLKGSYGNIDGPVSTDLRVDQPGRYTAWVRFKLLPGFFANWRLSVQGPSGGVSWDHIADNYPNEWQRIGQINVNRAGNVRLQIAPLPAQKPNTYRVIHQVLLTAQDNFVPTGDVQASGAKNNAMSVAQPVVNVGNQLQAWFNTDPYGAPLSQETMAGQGGAKTSGIALPSQAQTSVLVGLRNLTGAPVTLGVNSTLSGAQGDVPGGATWRVVAFAPYVTNANAPNNFSWSPFALLRRPGITVPPQGVAGLWITLDSQNVPAGNYNLRVNLFGATQSNLTLPVRISRVRAMPQRPILISGYTDPPEGEIYWQDARAHGIGVGYSVMTKDEMNRRGLRLLSLKVSTPEEVTTRLEEVRRAGLNYNDWVFAVKDEPGGNVAQLQPYLELAQFIRQSDSRAGISFNPGESATPETFRVLDSYANILMPFARHLVNPPADVPAKRAIFSAKPWLWYTTPAYRDKEPQTPQTVFDQIRSYPTQPGINLGTAFFAMNYPFRDGWDTAYEFVPDVSTFVLQSHNGPVATPAWEAVREAGIEANLAQMVKERGGNAQLIAKGSTAELLQWLEANGG